MAKNAYIGVSGVARKVKQPYIGVSGVARKVKSGYIGVSGVARQFFALPTWKKYNVTKSLDELGWVGSGFVYVTWNEASTWYSDSDTGFNLQWDLDANLNISNVRFASPYEHITGVSTKTSSSGTTTTIRGSASSPVYYLFGADSYSHRYNDDGDIIGSNCTGKDINNSKYVMRAGVTKNYKTSTTYGWKRNVSCGSYISDVTAPEGTYPDIGIHSDGYWYVKQ